MTADAGRPARASVRRQEWSAVAPPDHQRIREIWEEAFPPNERSEHDTVSRRDSTWLWTAHLPDEGLVGFATALHLPTARVAYLEYLAVAPEVRGSGAGAALLAAIVDDLDSEPSVQGVALEVEDPARTPGNDPMLTRRIGFYERWGARPASLLTDYSMPDLAVPGARVPMIVLWRGVRDNPELDADQVERLLTDLFRGYYAHAAVEGHLEEMVGRISRDGPRTTR
ncbi:GNAT family N-acetyltransferase [Umezawaea tangerina]|uniref:Acetyltransferase (GNAT) family protein n=1 Tax=Umezawaea tangerina TaxID=84725 RepID=A0A2T0S6Y1_9PSEU|nr:GNAT family N-acetyltransferase [Umezawaea tangerina]PRY29174.1 acetyltransferase (GNAT) family protein [Umezawaea tangerina]